jgi:hypothetical protein
MLLLSAPHAVMRPIRDGVCEVASQNRVGQDNKGFEMKMSLGVVGLAVALGFPLGASAIQYNWNLGGTTINPGSGGLNNGACGAGVACELTFTAGGKTLRARVYSTQTVYTDASQASGAAGPLSNYSGKFVAGEIARYTGGLGEKNKIAGDTGEGSAPEHSIDNQQIKDVIVFEAPDADFRWEALSLGWSSGDSDVQVFVGSGVSGLNTPNLDFRTLCFTGCGASTSIMDAASGFTNLGTYTDVYQAGGAPNPIDLTKKANGTAVSATGRYLVVSGALGDSSITGWNDYFKVNGVKGSVPEPQTLGLLALGLLALCSVARRPVGGRTSLA